MSAARVSRLLFLIVCLATVLLLPIGEVAARTKREDYASRRAKALKKTGSARAKALVKLAKWCRRKVLLDEERACLEEAAKLDEKAVGNRLKKLLNKEKFHQRYETPWRKEASFLVVATNTREARLEFYCQAFAAFYNRFRKTFGVKVNPMKVWGSKIVVSIWRTRKDFERYQRDKADTGLGETTVGYYEPNRGELVLYEDPEDVAETVNTLFHEGTHLLMDLALGNKSKNVPMWMSEGLAEYFGASQLDEDEDEIVTGGLHLPRLEEAVDLLDAKRLKPLETLLGLPYETFESPDYAQSWMLLHMLIEKEDSKGKKVYRKKFIKLYEAIAAGRDATASFKALFGDLDALGKESAEYIEGFRKHLKKAKKKDKKSGAGKNRGNKKGAGQ